MLNSRRLSGCLTARLQDSSLGGFRSIVSSHLNGFAEAGQFLNVQRLRATKGEERLSYPGSAHGTLSIDEYCFQNPPILLDARTVHMEHFW